MNNRYALLTHKQAKFYHQISNASVAKPGSGRLPAAVLTGLIFIVSLLLVQCKNEKEGQATQAGLQAQLSGVESITGRKEYIHSPYVTAGDRVYMIGHQDGQFPDLGWHVTGEMGGIWNHPIKLMDGFTAAIQTDGQSFCLAEADTFINYPFANKHIYPATPTGLHVERFQFVPDEKEAVAIEYTFTNNSSAAKNITFTFTGYTDLRPVWLGERTNMQDGGDAAVYDAPTRSYVAKDSLNEWYVMFGSTLQPEAKQTRNGNCAYAPAGKGTSASLRFVLEIPSNSAVTLPITIAGSYKSLQQAKEIYAAVQTNTARLLSAKKERYATIARKTRLTIPDKKLQQAFEWIKYNTDWLIRDVPEIGRGLSAGLPDYPWWFGVDNEYALQGVIAAGQKDIVYSTIDLLHKLSEKENGNGRIVHEVSTNGAVFNPGNINETPQFASLIWQVYTWTGDKELLKKYFPTIKKGLAWLHQQNDADANLLPEGFGMMEIHGLNSEMIDVAVYTQKAFADAAEMAQEMGERSLSEKYRNIASQLSKKINTEFWVPEYKSYADFISTTSQALHLIDDAIVRADTLNKPWAVEELKATRKKIAGYPPQKKQGFVVHHNWVVNTPMETGIADTAKALVALQTGSRFVNPFGMFVTGIDRDESAGEDDSSFAPERKVFTYTGAVMTLPTGVQAIGENNYGRPDQALDYLQRMTRTFSYAFPGSIYEVSPDYGMMSQAWNIYSFAIPVVQQFFGIHPMAHQRTIRIQPQMPASWNEASLENVQTGENEISMVYKRTSGAVQLTINQTKPDWKIAVAFPNNQFKNWRVNGEKVNPKADGNYAVAEISGSKVVVELM